MSEEDDKIAHFMILANLGIAWVCVSNQQFATDCQDWAEVLVTLAFLCRNATREVSLALFGRDKFPDCAE
jgi:hypothetical protein